MEVLLLQDISGVGKKNDILVVGDGFALNCLLPQRQALVATPTVRKRYAEQIRKRAEERDTERKLQLETAAALAGKSVLVERKAGKAGKLYAAVSAAELADIINAQLSTKLTAADVLISDPIKAPGSVQVQLVIAGSQYPLTIVVKAVEAKK